MNRAEAQRAGGKLSTEQIRQLFIDHWNRVGRVRHSFLETLHGRRSDQMSIDDKPVEIQRTYRGRHDNTEYSF